ncbi:polyketide cyclase [Thiorhodococcus mannitoliphagus]|uniref:Polyketide cyclase n=1 Tax=Thiorhodococcus mannitoliphagus TaxID=329406 RepID=A0A6P1DSC3_9GAMM|nr:polyketide cyclase [Thiorhodococcus mannitoliphagus]
MVRGEASILIDTEASRVFDFVATDFVNNYKRWSPEVQRLDLLTPGPLRVGSRARQIRVDQGRKSDTTFKIIALETPSRVGFVEQNGQYRTEYHVEPAGEGSRLRFYFELKRLDLYMRPFEKLIRVAIQDGAERVVRNIKGLIETETPRSSTGPS